MVVRAVIPQFSLTYYVITFDFLLAASREPSVSPPQPPEGFPSVTYLSATMYKVYNNQVFVHPMRRDFIMGRRPKRPVS